MSTKKHRDLELVDRVFHEAAEIEAETGSLDEVDRQALREVEDIAGKAARRARERVLEQARAERLAATAQSVPARILSMTREAVVARLRELEALLPARLAVQHRKLEDRSVDDLRSLLADIELQLDE